MQGFQFAHMEIWSAKGSSNADPEMKPTRKNGQRAWTAAQIIDELERLAEASAHVIPGRPGPQILAGEVTSFSELRQAHAEVLAIRERFPYRQKDGTMTTRERKLRADAPTLYASVVSLPVRTEDALADPAVRAESMRVLRDAMAHERQRIAALGGKLMMGVVHLDEEHLHIHLIALDPARGRVDHLHPGRVAKSAYHAEHKDSGQDRAMLRREGNEAYRAAMRGWQDDFNREVFDPAGLLRFGPRRQRLNRKEYAEAKDAKAREARDRRRQAELIAENAALAATAAAEEERRRELRGREAEVGIAAQDVIERRAKVKEDERLASDARSAAEKAKAEAEAFGQAMMVGTEAVLTRQIDYRPATPERDEGLKLGLNKPASLTAQEALKAAVQPAYDVLVGFAKKVAGLWARLAQAERAEADQRRRAAILREAEERAGRVADPALAALAEGKGLGSAAVAFPGAFAIAAGADPKVLSEALAKMPNLSLRERHRATADAVLLCDDAAVCEGFRRGAAVLERTARARGFDLASGRHDPAKAADPAEARRHRDQLPDPIRVEGGARDRQRVRG